MPISSPETDPIKLQQAFKRHKIFFGGALDYQDALGLVRKLDLLQALKSKQDALDRILRELDHLQVQGETLSKQQAEDFDYKLRIFKAFRDVVVQCCDKSSGASKILDDLQDKGSDMPAFVSSVSSIWHYLTKYGSQYQLVVCRSRATSKHANPGPMGVGRPTLYEGRLS